MQLLDAAPVTPTQAGQQNLQPFNTRTLFEIGDGGDRTQPTNVIENEIFGKGINCFPRQDKELPAITDGAMTGSQYSNLPLKRRTPTRLAAKVINRACEYIQANLAENIRQVEIARAAGVSPNHFATPFRRATGLTPHQYLISRRVERSKELLLNSDLTIAEVAMEVGFADQSHLTRHMRRRLGVTPAVFKQNQTVQGSR